TSGFQRPPATSAAAADIHLAKTLRLTLICLTHSGPVARIRALNGVHYTQRALHLRAHFRWPDRQCGFRRGDQIEVEWYSVTGVAPEHERETDTRHTDN